MKKRDCVLCKVTAQDTYGQYQLRWGDQDMGTAISFTKCSQVAGLIHMIEAPC